MSVATPPLPEGPLTGNVYVGEQKSRDPESGDEYRIFVAAESARYGISVRLVGNVVANAKTGQLTAVFDEPAKTNVLRGGNADNLPSGLPQVPFTSFKISVDGGPKAALSSPPTCGPNQTTSQLAPWSGNPAATPSSKFDSGCAPWRRRLSENDGRAAVRPRLQRQAEIRRGQNLHPLLRLHQPPARPAGAERPRRDAAAKARPRS